jgi:iron complex outermembrane receptor protein
MKRTPLYQTNGYRPLRFVLSIALVMVASALYGQVSDDSPDVLKKLSIEELLNLEVTSVSKRPEKLTETPSAVQVVTGDDISKFGASNIPEALYLAGNLQVAQKGSHSFGISARGFNTDLANKLLVLVDGRTVYTPLYSGVFWDRQDYLLEDINRIEVISGPGGTLWGANAVNGVINITSKTAKETQGVYMEGAAGNELKALAGFRYGGKIAPNVFYRVYGRYGNRDNAIFEDSVASNDSWQMGQGGFRIDADGKSTSKYTLQGDIYQNNGKQNTAGPSTVNGGNLLGRWSHMFADSSDIRVQTYYDRTYLNAPTAAFVANGLELAPAGLFKDVLSTYDIDFQHRIRFGTANHFVWGLGYRFTHDEVTNAPALGFFPTVLKQNLFSVFAQDEINVVKNLKLIVGSKLEHNDYTGFVLEPHGRLSWFMNDKNILWTGVSRAVRTPSRIDRDLSQGTPPYFVLLTGSPNFRSETVVATELGYRTQVGSRTTGSLSLYYNQYDHLRSTELNPTTIFPLFFQNGLEGETYGFELSLNYQVTDWWRLFTSYNLFRGDIRVKENKSDFNNAHNETADPRNQFSLRSSFSLPFRLSVNPAFRWVDELPINDSGILRTVPAYAELDGSINWEATDYMSFTLAGRNLLNKAHVEYGAPGPARQAIQRSVYIKVALRF